MKKIFANKKIVIYVLIFIMAIIVSIPLYDSSLAIYKDDGIQHICRLIGTYDSILEGQKFPVIMSDYCNGFGYSWNIFYSPLTSFFPLIFKIFTNSFTICLKIFIFISIFLSGIFMQKFVKTVTKSDKISIVSSLVYMVAPYHLVDVYIRCAIGEVVAFVFIPIVFLGLYNIFYNDTKKDYYLTIGAVRFNIITYYIYFYYNIFLYSICIVKC